MEEVLSLQGVSKKFGGVAALNDINMKIKEGSHIGIIGPNGAGKTTLFNVITGEHRQSSGKIVLFGEDVTRKPVRKRVALGLSRTYQSTSVFDTLTVEQNISLSLCGLSRSQFNMFNSENRDLVHSARIKEIAEAIGLKEKLKTVSSDLSHGEKRQLEIGLAISKSPHLVMLDEPAAGLSPFERDGMVKLLNLLLRDITLLIIEHDMGVAFKIAKYIFVLHEGRIIAEGSPKEISSDPIVQEVYFGGRMDE